ncbi:MULTISPECIES: hypothetical protein [unclassified Amycolatopsis]|uniref:hypothetical protein n=1 Tax=unclassified Amycolatopsis TaxID=2618356 RepID=UPI002876B35C|nr:MULTISPECIES: hypothetical protein [unclassified Amycolatopsis]MDS0135887.1 hypothetical protein [Amycolatopsis sp. 505]MDS0145524.1 hypothetical protein [Amycolatopsis sp. CM201R]
MTPDAVATADAVAGLPEVAGPHGGRVGEIATLLPGRRVAGVRVADDELTIGVVLRYPATAAAAAAAVRAALGPLDRPVRVFVGDVAVPTTS